MLIVATVVANPPREWEFHGVHGVHVYVLSTNSRNVMQYNARGYNSKRYRRVFRSADERFAINVDWFFVLVKEALCRNFSQDRSNEIHTIRLSVTLDTF